MIVIAIKGKPFPRGKRSSCLGCPLYDEDGPQGLCSGDVEDLLDRGCPQVGQAHQTREYRSSPDLDEYDPLAEEAPQESLVAV